MKPTEFFTRHPVFRFEEFRTAHLAGGERSPATTASVLKQHVAAGHLLNVRRGLYARVPEEARRGADRSTAPEHRHRGVRRRRERRPEHRRRSSRRLQGQRVPARSGARG